MNAYDRKAQDAKNRSFIMEEARTLMEHADLLSLSTLHDLDGFGRIRLERFYRGFQDTYEDYKRRYLTARDSRVCGERIDTGVLKNHLYQIGFDYDALAAELSYKWYTLRPGPASTAQLREKRAIVLREVLSVMEHSNLVSLITLHDFEGYGRTRMERYFRIFQTDYNEYLYLYTAADGRTIGKEHAASQVLKQNLLAIGFDYDALVYELVHGYR